MHAALTYLGVQSSPGEISAALGAPDHAIVSLEQLDRVAKRFGVSTRAAQLSVSDLLKEHTVAILAMDNQHFVALVGIQAGNPLVVDARRVGDTRADLWSRARLESRWSGIAPLLHRNRRNPNKE